MFTRESYGGGDFVFFHCHILIYDEPKKKGLVAWIVKSDQEQREISRKTKRNEKKFLNRGGESPLDSFCCGLF